MGRGSDESPACPVGGRHRGIARQIEMHVPRDIATMSLRLHYEGPWCYIQVR